MAKSFNLTPPAPAAAFISAQPVPADPVLSEKERDVPAGYELKRASKSKRLNLLVRPTTHDKLCELAAAATAMAPNGKKLSVNELINRILEENISNIDPAELAHSLND